MHRNNTKSRPQMYLILDVLTKSNDDRRLSKNRSYDMVLEDYLSDKTESNKFLNDIHYNIGLIVVCLLIFYLIVLMIIKCVKHNQKGAQSEDNIQSNVSLIGEPIIRRNSSIRNPFAPNRPSSLDVRFQMASRERRLLQPNLIPLTIHKT